MSFMQSSYEFTVVDGIYTAVISGTCDQFWECVKKLWESRPLDNARQFDHTNFEIIDDDDEPPKHVTTRKTRTSYTSYQGSKFDDKQQ